MPYDKTKAIRFAQDNALPVFGNHQCARYVREALEAGGLNTAGHPTAAKNWGPTLVKMGFSNISSGSYTPSAGDVVVFQGGEYGHIELFDGKSWISDFIQPDFWPSRSFEATRVPYQIYRYQ